MSDHKAKVGQDRNLMNLKENHGRRDWAESLGVTEERRVDAVKSAGNSFEEVSEQLRSENS